MYRITKGFTIVNDESTRQYAHCVACVEQEAEITPAQWRRLFDDTGGVLGFAADVARKGYPFPRHPITACIAYRSIHETSNRLNYLWVQDRLGEIDPDIYPGIVPYIHGQMLRYFTRETARLDGRRIDHVLELFTESYEAGFPLAAEALGSVLHSGYTKPTIAAFYNEAIVVGDPEGARSILGEVLEEGNDQQKDEAEALISKLA